MLLWLEQCMCCYQVSHTHIASVCLLCSCLSSFSAKLESGALRSPDLTAVPLIYKH